MGCAGSDSSSDRDGSYNAPGVYRAKCVGEGNSDTRVGLLYVSVGETMGEEAGDSSLA